MSETYHAFTTSDDTSGIDARRHNRTPARPRPAWRFAALGVVLLAAACSGNAVPQPDAPTDTPSFAIPKPGNAPAFVDCTRSPHGVASLELDIRKPSNEYIGNASLNNGQIVWRDKYQAISIGNGQAGIAADNIAPLGNYNDIAANRIPPITNVDTGGTISMQATVPQDGHTIVATYSC